MKDDDEEEEQEEQETGGRGGGGEGGGGAAGLGRVARTEGDEVKARSREGTQENNLH